MKTIKNRINLAAINAQNTLGNVRDKLRDNAGDFTVDKSVVFVIVIVLGAAALALLKTFLSNDMAPVVKEKIMAFFN